MRKKFIAGVLTASMMVPMLAFAQTDTQSQIQSLLSQIRALQEQLRVLIASSTPRIIDRDENRGQLGKRICLMLSRDLGPGSRGEDVRKLQEWLAEDRENGFNAEATGIFGPMTARAIAKFQMRTGIASSTDGRVGPLTRGFFERACGKGLSDRDDDVEKKRIAGEITATSGSTITVKAANGDSKVVNINASTTIKVFTTGTSTPTTGSMSDLTVGKKVVIAGTSSGSGTFTALSVHVGMPPPPPLMKKLFKFDHKGKKVLERDIEDDEEDD